VFTDANKFDGNSTRMLYSHEYTQMAGRAGRRGIDDVGHVIHLNNLFRNVELTEYKLMMQGKPQKLVSKFKISYNLLLSLVDSGDQNFLGFVERSMIQEDIHSVLGGIMKTINDLERSLETINETMSCMRTPLDAVQQYIRCVNERKTAVNKKRKDLDRDISRIEDEYKTLQRDVTVVSKYNTVTDDLSKTQIQFQDAEQYLQTSITSVLKFMEKEGFLFFDSTENRYKLTMYGQLATHIREVHCLAFAKLIESNAFQTFTSKDLVCLFSLFTNITVNDEKRTLGLKNVQGISNENLIKVMGNITQQYDDYEKFESVCQVKTGADYNMHYDLCSYIVEWCDCSNQQDCKIVLQKLEQEKEIFLGEFVKAILKINNISSEMERVAESIGNIALLSALREIPEMTLKYVATNQSLYV
jgi:superfamily II RNA helicase